MNVASLPAVFYFVVMGLVVIGWGALIFFPTRHWANFWFAGLVVPLALSGVGIYFLVVFWFQPPAEDLSHYLSLSGVYASFGNSGLFLAAWIDIIAMDLVVGAWMARRAAQTRMPYIYLLPCLIFTFVFAGVGFVLFCVAMSFGERWGAIAAIERVKPLPRPSFPPILTNPEVVP